MPVTLSLPFTPVILILICYVLHVVGANENDSTPANTVEKRYNMTERKDGPFCKLYKDFYRVVYKKSKLVLTNIFQFTTRAVEKLNSQSAFSWLGELETVTQQAIKREFQETPTEKLKVRARALYDRMLTRRKYYNVEVNMVLAYFNDIFTEKDIARGNQTIRDFDAYPRVDKTPFTICVDLLTAFNEPFRTNKRDHCFGNNLLLIEEILRNQYPDLFEDNETSTSSSSEEGAHTKRRHPLHVTKTLWV